MTRHWGNPEWIPVHCSFNTEKLWSELSRITIEFINREKNKEVLCNYVMGKQMEPIP